jgi:hypothetical protein
MVSFIRTVFSSLKIFFFALALSFGLTVVFYSILILERFQNSKESFQKDYLRREEQLSHGFSDLAAAVTTLAGMPPTLGILRSMENGGVDTLDGIPIENMKGRYEKMARLFLENQILLDRIDFLTHKGDLVLQVYKTADQILTKDPSRNLEADDNSSFPKDKITKVLSQDPAMKLSAEFYSIDGEEKGFYFVYPIFEKATPKGVLAFHLSLGALSNKMGSNASPSIWAEWIHEVIVDQDGNAVFIRPPSARTWQVAAAKDTSDFIEHTKQSTKWTSEWVHPQASQPSVGWQIHSFYESNDLARTLVLGQKAMLLKMFSALFVLFFALEFFRLYAPLIYKKRQPESGEPEKSATAVTPPWDKPLLRRKLGLFRQILGQLHTLQEGQRKAPLENLEFFEQKSKRLSALLQKAVDDFENTTCKEIEIPQDENLVSDKDPKAA